jgi:hypothetical protein
MGWRTHAQSGSHSRLYAAPDAKNNRMNWWTRQRKMPPEVMHRRCVVIGRVALGVLLLPYPTFIAIDCLLHVSRTWEWVAYAWIVLFMISVPVGFLCGLYSWIAWWNFCSGMRSPRCGIVANILGTFPMAIFTAMAWH